MDTRELAHQAQRIASSELDLESACLAFDGLLRKVVPYSVAAWSTQDPATGLFTSCTVSGMPKDLEREAQIFRHEYEEDEPSTFGSMIAAGRTVAVLSQETGGDLERAARYREFLRDVGCTDELRSILWADGQPWGSVALYAMGGGSGPTTRDTWRRWLPTLRTDCAWCCSGPLQRHRRPLPIRQGSSARWRMVA